MNKSNIKILIVFAVGCLVGFFLFKIIGQRAYEQATQSSIQNALELKRMQVAFIAMKKKVEAAAATTIMYESKLSQLQEKVDVLVKSSEKAVKLAGEDFAKAHLIEIGSSPVKGARNASVTIVQFVDIQCPFCARFYPVVDEVLKVFPNKVNFVLKNFPLSFHLSARTAAKLALAANEQGKYFEMIELLLQNNAEVNEKKAKEYSKKLRLNFNRLMKDFKEKDAQWEKQINDDMQLGQQVDVRGTPTFYINGRKTQARDLAAFKTEIDLILQ